MRLALHSAPMTSQPGPAFARPGRLLRNALDRLTVAGAQDRPVLVGGCPRSGTTLLRTMLHAHPDLAIPRETKFILESFRRRREWGDLRDTSNRRRLVDWIIDSKGTGFRRLKLDPDDARRRMIEAPPTLGSVLGTALVMYAERKGASRWGDKRPMHILQLPAIYALFPDAHFVNIVRDPRAVVASMKKLGWLEEWYDGTVVGAVARWVRSVRAGRTALRRYRADQYLELRYEDLIAQPDVALKNICSFAHLEDRISDMLSFQEKASEIPDRMRSKYHPLLGEPITTDANFGWTDQLSPGEVALIERVAAREMRLYGYEPTMNGVAVPADLLDRWDAHRRKKRGRPGATWSRYPLAARLTTAERRRARLIAMVRRR